MPGIDLAHNPELRKAWELWGPIYPRIKDGELDDYDLKNIFEKNKFLVFKWFPYIICNCSWDDETAFKIKEVWIKDTWFEDYDKFVY